jgi:hypothetical protein
VDFNGLNLDAEKVAQALPEGPWWHFDQNNSGGYFAGPKNVFLIAETQEAAEELLKSVPDYTDSFCSCCGERWYGSACSKAQVVEEIVRLSDPKCFARTFSPMDLTTFVIMAQPSEVFDPSI